MANVVFVNPPSSRQGVYKEFASSSGLLPPLGLCYLAGAARRAGHKAAILDAQAENLDIEEAGRRIAGLRPDVVGITAFTNWIQSAGQLAEQSKKTLPQVPVVVGGPHLTALPEGTLRDLPGIDIGVVGEGEDTIVDLLDALGSGQRPLSEVPGLVIRDGGRLQRTPARRLIDRLDRLADPAWDLLEGFPGRYRPGVINIGALPSTVIVTSRGCPGRCTFCDRGAFGSRCRGHSAERLLAMVETLHRRFGVRDLQVADDTFVMFPKRLTAFCESLIRADLDIVWNCNARVDMVKPEMLRLMRRAGCWQIAFGIESGSQRMLDFWKKGTDLATIERAVRWSKEAGLAVKGYIMVGGPTETRESLDQTLRFIKKLKLEMLRLTYFTPMPGSQVYDEVTRYGSFSPHWQRLNMQNLNFVPHGLSVRELEDFTRRAYRASYLRKPAVAFFARRMANPVVAKGLLRAGWHFLKFSLPHWPRGKGLPSAAGNEDGPAGDYYKTSREFFDTTARTGDGVCWTLGSLTDKAVERVQEHAFRMLNSDSCRRVLDVGCGKGDLALRLARSRPQTTVDGVDFAPDMVALASGRGAALLNLSFRMADILDLDVPDDSYDGVFCLNVLHHIRPQDLPRAIRELSRVARSFVIVEIKNGRSPLKWIRKRLVRQRVRTFEPNPGDVVRMFAEQGMNLAEFRPIMRPGWLSPLVVMRLTAAAAPAGQQEGER